MNNYLLSHFPAWLICLVMAVISILMSILSLKVIHKLFPSTVLKENKAAITNYVNVLSILYSIILAFLVVGAWENYQHVKDTMEKEGNAIGDIYHDMEVFPDSVRMSVQNTLIQYVSLVVKKEWAEQEIGNEDKEANALIHSIRHIIHPKSTESLLIYPMLMEHINTACINRRMRVTNGVSDIPALIWSILLIGALTIVFLSGFFHLEHSRLK